jgi:energy-coupling factor transporter ATP-binding protein EcfA2
MSDNSAFELAFELVNNTNKHVFLTGKAGTGKTTFLKHIASNAKKNFAIVAPTGVAAINAGGVTMHSLLQLPMGTFLPGTAPAFQSNTNVTDKHSLFKNIRFHGQKLELLRELNLLIIDEISMVRADMLDAADLILRFARRNQLPFGGLQVLYIGDMFQLPPVVKEDEWQLLKQYYEGIFFFQSEVFKKVEPVHIELKKIYRQTDNTFINILNRVRNNELEEEDFDILNQRFNANYQAQENEITLCTHNNKADAINQEKLKNIFNPKFQYNATTKGEINENSLPAEKTLVLKIGAQVMFLKNDPDGVFFNGKIGIVTQLNNEEIKVKFAGQTEEHLVKKHTWRNIKYKLDKTSNKIKEEETGTFEQFPIKLAWAITIHKSQGLTFENVVIDAGQSFAAGQVYVALSRCTQLEGIKLISKITQDGVRTDPNIIEFSSKSTKERTIINIIEQEKKAYMGQTLLGYFNWDKVVHQFEQFASMLPTRQIPDMSITVLFFKELEDRLIAQRGIADNFKNQLNNILTSYEIDENLLIERCTKAIQYFKTDLKEKIITPLDQYIRKIEKEKRVKGFLKDVEELNNLVVGLFNKIQKAHYNNATFISDNKTDIIDFEKIEKPKKEKRPVGSSKYETLTMFKLGKSMAQIANDRKMAISTIEGHFLELTKTAEISVYDWIDKFKIASILSYIKPDVGVAGIVQDMNNTASYNEVRAVMIYEKMEK